MFFRPFMHGKSFSETGGSVNGRRGKPGGRIRFPGSFLCLPACATFQMVKPNHFPDSRANDGDVRCPCCGTQGRSSVVMSVPYREIWDLLAAEWGARFPRDVVQRHTPCEETCLAECGECGLQFFDPPVGGDADFYRTLGGSPLYYISGKWEFGLVKERLSPSMTVLDVGCGNGDFLAGIASFVRRAVGLEQNPDAAAAARGRRVEVVEGDAESFARDNAGSFDAVCAFHVVEHLPSPASFLRILAKCMRPGGSLFISMPNRLRSTPTSLDPLDCPPHHLSRWSPAQLRRLGDILGIGLERISLEPVENSVPRAALRDRVTKVTGKFPVGGDFLGVWIHRFLWRLVLSDPLCSVYRRFGFLERMGFIGTSMLGHFVRPDR